jgi:hypothetical protein
MSPAEHVPYQPGETANFTTVYNVGFSEGGVGPHGQKLFVPEGQIWRVMGARGTFTSSVQVANRSPHIGMTWDATGKTIATVWPPKVTTAGQVWWVRAFVGLGTVLMTEWPAAIEGITGVIQLPLQPFLLRGAAAGSGLGNEAGNKIYFESLGEQSEDKWTELSLAYERVQ